MRPIRPDDIRRFCEVDRWESKDAKAGKTLPDGSVLRTKASRGNKEIGGDLARHILRDQLGVTETQFWKAVDEGVPPVRAGEDPRPPQGSTLPGWLVVALVHTVGLPERPVAGMSEDAARKAWQEWITSPRDAR
ncbi:MAG: cytotoxic translational repressor of toxin-antitoxin stability system [Egibacteraceae bacterium]